MSNVTLSAAVRAQLLSLNNTTDLINTTNKRLASGLKVSSAIDDAVAYFQAKGLNDRSSDFLEKKSGIDQGISTLTAASDGVDGIDSLVRQLKGVAQSMKSATGSAFSDLITQFNDLRTQIGHLADDATYQGSDLINNTSDTLEVSFSNQTGSMITINAVNVRESGLGINTVAVANASNSFTYGSYTASDVAVGDTITLTYKGSVYTVGSGETVSFSMGTSTVTLRTNSNAPITLAYNDAITVKVGSTATAGDALAAGGWTVSQTAAGLMTGGTMAASTTSYVYEGGTNAVNDVISTLDTALTTLRSQAQKLGSNIALLKTRLDFTTNYTNTLTGGAGKLNLADLNEEGANLLALQTRQQLGINSLSFAGQAEQSILSLFR